MKCDYCNHNEAEHTFRALIMGEEREIHLCGECMHKFRQHYESVARQQAMAGGAGRDTKRNPFPPDAGEDVRSRRLLGGLKARLQEAIEQEQYEEAARLRDEIAYHEKEVYACES